MSPQIFQSLNTIEWMLIAILGILLIGGMYYFSDSERRKGASARFSSGWDYAKSGITSRFGSSSKSESDPKASGETADKPLVGGRRGKRRTPHRRRY